MVRWLVLGLAIGWPGTGFAQVIVDASGASVPEPLRKLALSKVSDKFKDPVSTQFRKLAVVSSKTPDNDVICGQVNSKNSYGAYTGFQFFTYIRLGKNDVADVAPTDFETKMSSRPDLIAPYRAAGCLP